MPDEVKKQIAFTFVATMDEVLRLALLPAEMDDGPPRRESRATTPPRDAAASVPVTRETGTRGQRGSTLIAAGSITPDMPSGRSV